LPFASYAVTELSDFETATNEVSPSDTDDHVRDQDLLPQLTEVLVGIQTLKQLRAQMELLGEAIQWRFETKVLQLGLFQGVPRHYTERPHHIFLGNRIGGECRSRIRIPFFPRRSIYRPFGRKFFDYAGNGTRASQKACAYILSNRQRHVTLSAVASHASDQTPLAESHS